MTRSATIRTNIDANAKSCRRGITLLEVLISMFVALVGLSGLAALFWLGGIEMSEGAKLDRAMSVGRSALRSLKIYGMLRPIQTYTSTSGFVTTNTQVQMWITPNHATVDGSGNNAATVPAVMPFTTTSFGTSPPPGVPSVAYGDYMQGFAIDPIGTAVNQGQNDPNGFPLSPGFPSIDATSSSVNPGPFRYFPAPPTTAGPTYAYPVTATGPSATPPKVGCLNRITLQAYPQNSTNLSYPQSLTGLTAGQADLIFRSGDDLILNPPNGDFPPTQDFSKLITLSGTYSGRRQSQGDYSWLATVVPTVISYDAYTPPMGMNPTTFTPSGDTNLVRVSIVVFYKRVPAILIDPTFTIPPSERMVNVQWGTGTAIGYDGTTATGVATTGIAGGDLQLSCAYAGYLNLKAGQWIMLSQLPQTGTSSGTNQFHSNYWYRWFKVVATGPVLGPIAGIYYRNVTLSGPDWNPTFATFASIFDGVVAVYEKEIELEPSGAPLAPN